MPLSSVSQALYWQEEQRVYIPHNLERFLHDSYTEMRAIVDQSGDIVLGHLGQLFLEYALKTRQDDGALPAPIVVDHSELDLAISLFDDSRLLGKRYDAFGRWWGGISGGIALALAFGRRGRLLDALGGALDGLGSGFALG